MKFRIQAVVALLAAGCMPAAGKMMSSHALASPSAPPAGLANSYEPQLERPVARVNGNVLTNRDLLREMFAIFPYARQHNGGFPKAMEADIRRGALKMIEFEELVYQEALRRKMTVAPARVDKAEREFQTQLGGEQQYQDYLKFETNGSRQLMRKKIQRSLLIEDLLKAEVTEKSEVSLAEARRHYEENPKEFQLPESFALQTITVLPPKNTTPENMKQMRAKAESALQQAKKTSNYEEFGVLAEKISEDDYRVMMGDHRSVGVDDLPAPVLQAARSLPIGQVSGLIEADSTLTIIRVNAHNPARMQKFEEVSVGLRQELQRRKTERLRSSLDARLRKSAKVEEL